MQKSVERITLSISTGVCHQGFVAFQYGGRETIKIPLPPYLKPSVEDNPASNDERFKTLFHMLQLLAT